MMTKKIYDVSVTKIIRVELDEGKLDAEFWDEFNETIADRGGPDDAYLAKHIAWNFVQGDTDFVEGVGPLSEMNIKAREIDADMESEEIT